MDGFIFTIYIVDLGKSCSNPTKTCLNQSRSVLGLVLVKSRFSSCKTLGFVAVFSDLSSVVISLVLGSSVFILVWVPALFTVPCFLQHGLFLEQMLSSHVLPSPSPERQSRGSEIRLWLAALRDVSSISCWSSITTTKAWSVEPRTQREPKDTTAFPFPPKETTENHPFLYFISSAKKTQAFKTFRKGTTLPHLDGFEAGFALSFWLPLLQQVSPLFSGFGGFNRLFWACFSHLRFYQPWIRQL